MSAVIVLVGPPGSGKSSFASQRWRWHQILSSDVFRMLLTDDPEDMSVNDLVFDALHSFLNVRCRRRQTTVVDATNIRPEHRAPLIQAAHRNLMVPVAIHFDPGLNTCLDRNEQRPEAARAPEGRVKTMWEDLRWQDLSAEFPVVRVIGDTTDVVVGTIPRDQVGAMWTT